MEVQRVAEAAGVERLPKETSESELEGTAPSVPEGDFRQRGRLPKKRQGHPRNVKLARRPKGKTTVSLKWIAENVSMGTWTHVANLLRPRPRSVKDED